MFWKIGRHGSRAPGREGQAHPACPVFWYDDIKTNDEFMEFDAQIDPVPEFTFMEDSSIFRKIDSNVVDYKTNFDRGMRTRYVTAGDPEEKIKLNYAPQGIRA